MWFLYAFLYTLYIHPIHIEGQDEGQKVATRKVEDGQKNLFLEMLGDLWGVICYHHWYLRASLEAQNKKKYFSEKVSRSKKMQNYPLSIFHASVRPESLPGADLSTFQKVIFSQFFCH